MTAPPPVVLFYDKQFIVIVAKDNDAICASHAAQGIDTVDNSAGGGTGF